MKIIKLIHWNTVESKELAQSIKIPDAKIDFDLTSGPALFKELQLNPPDLFIISLDRLPSQGRDMAIHLRQKKNTQQIPIIFAGGENEKVDKIKKLFPDAVFTTWDKISTAIKSNISKKVANPIVHDSVFAPYKGTPLIKKMGIAQNTKLSLLNAPPDFEKTLGELPGGVIVRSDLRVKCETIIWFAESSDEVEKRIIAVSKGLADKGKVWIAWRKQASGTATNLTQVVVRKIGLANGLVDYKICSIDDIWSALLFTKRK